VPAVPTNDLNAPGRKVEKKFRILLFIHPAGELGRPGKIAEKDGDGAFVFALRSAAVNASIVCLCHTDTPPVRGGEE